MYIWTQSVNIYKYKCTLLHKCWILTFQVSFNLLEHEMQLSGAISIGVMVEWTDSQFYLSQLFTYWICVLAYCVTSIIIKYEKNA